MWRSLAFTSALLLFLAARVAAATPQETQITIFPFEINAEEDLGYLRDGIPNQLSDRLKAVGFSVFSQVETDALLEKEGITELDLATVKDLTLLSRSQYGVYGSFSQVGETISIDVRVVEAFGLKEPKALFVVKQGLINLLPAIDELAEGIRREVVREERVGEIKVQGVQVIGEDVVLSRVSQREGEPLDRKIINEVVKQLFATGYFEDVTVTVSDGKDGKVVTFTVKEKPRIEAIGVKGADAIDEDDILEAMVTKTGSVLNDKVLAEDMAKIREMYRQKGYYTAKVSYSLEQSNDLVARLNVEVDEGQKLYIEDITIQGVEAFDEDDIKDELALGEKGLLSWITGKGVLKEEYLVRDAAAIEAYYGNRGFIDVQVGQPVIEYKDDGIYITFQVVEGERYTVDSVSFSGDLLFEPERMETLTRMPELAKDGDFFSRDVLREDAQAITDLYADYGYAFADVKPDVQKIDGEKKVKIDYKINQAQRVYIRRVEVEGNTKTRDRVIRRDVALADGDLFSGRALRTSTARLQRTEYFSEVDIQPVPTEREDEMDLKVRVKEQPTGSLSGGIGYSTSENVFFFAKVQERNLFGRAYDLSLSASIGSRTKLLDLSFWNPRLYDTNVAAGFDLFRQDQDWFSYKRESTGGRLKSAYGIGRFTSLFASYGLERYNIYDVDDDASQDVQDAEGYGTKSSLFTSLSRETLNRRMNPSDGTKNTLSVEYSGGVLGGDDNFVKYEYDSSLYYPLFWEVVFHGHARVGFVQENKSDDPVPPWEKFYLGGINDVRGYKDDRISPTDDEGNEIGGNKMFFGNLELLYPLSKDMGLTAVTFFDAGNVWDDDENVGGFLYKSVGAGIRWFSPLGPMRFEYAYPLNTLDGNKDGKFEFAVGQFF